MDWWNIRAEHTPYQWALQRAMYAVCPFGERRADLRTAINTVFAIVSQSPKEVATDDAKEMIRNLAEYLECERTKEEDEPDMDALKRMQQGGE